MRIPELLRPAAFALLGAGAGQSADAEYVAKRRAVALGCLRPAVALRWRKASQLRELRARVRRARDVVVYLPTIHWGYLQQRPHQLLRELGRRGWLSIFCTTRPAADRVDGFREVEPNVLLCSDPRLVLDVEDPVLWLNWAVNGALLPFFPRARLVYDWIDELEVFRFHCPRMHANHDALLRLADVVVASADRLLAAARRLRPDAVLAPNGVAPEDFATARVAPVPSDLAPVLARGRPIVGYYGALARWVDWALLDRVTAAAPELSFVLIGPDEDGSGRRVPRRSNVFALGEKPYAELPLYSRRFDVAIIPFEVSDVTRSISPVKLFEYLAAGAPVVTTPMDECRKYRAVAVADGPEAFLAAVRAAVGRRDDAAWQALAAREVRQNTWPARIDAILERLPARRCAATARSGGATA